jgi:DNA-binding MarR family transcriptional regulator
VQASEQVTAGYLVWRLTMKWRAAVERAVGPLGLTHAQYTLLASLRGLSRHGARPSQRELADYTGLEPVFVSRLARALEEAGFVARATHPGDPRAVQLRLTAHGTEVVDAAVRTVHELQEELAGPLGGTSGRRYRELIDSLRTLLGPWPTGGDEDMTQAPTSTLFGQDLGVASRAGQRLLDAVLEREAMTFPEWVTLKLVHDTGAAIPRDALLARLGTALDLDADEVLARLESNGLLATGTAGVELTEEGAARFATLFGAIRDLSAEVLAGLPAEDVATTRRILAEYTERAHGVLSRI